MPASTHRSIAQPSLFDVPGELPDGMRYAPDFIAPEEEQALVAEMAGLPFRAFEFHGFLGRRRTVSFGWSYDFNGGGLQQSGGIPDFLLPVRARAAAFAALDPAAPRAGGADRRICPGRFWASAGIVTVPPSMT